MPRTNSPLNLAVLAFCCLCLLPGCLAIPIPQGYRNLEREGKKIEAFQLSFVVPGQTTKAEFIEKIGQPYLTMDDLGVMVYYWKMLAAYVPWIAAGGYSAVGGVVEVDRYYLLLVAYDDRGIIERYETIRKIIQPKAVAAVARQWVGKGPSEGEAILAPPPAGKAVVYVFQASDFGGPERINGIFLDGNLWTELHAGEYTPIVVPAGIHVIGFERGVRTRDKFLDPGRGAEVPSLTTTIDLRPNQAYFLEVRFIERDSRDFKKTAVFSELSEEVALPKMAGLKRAR
jgi:hypothetical protein